MRPKLIALLAVSAVALVGCAASEPTVEPAQPSASTPDAAELSETLEAEPTSEPKDLFLESVHAVVDGNEDIFKGKEQNMISESYWLEKSDKYCEQIESGNTPVEPSTLSANGIQLERTIISSASQHLCPTD